MRHPTLAEVDPALLTTIGAAAMHALDSYGWLEHRAPRHARTMPEREPQPEPPAKRSHTRKPDAPARVYHSQYKGVSVNRRKFVGCWTENGSKRKSVGPLRERSAQGERWAAQDRARALGLDYLERRDGTREAYPRYDAEELAA